MRDTFVAALTKAAEIDDSIVLITGDLGFGVLDVFAKRFPKRFINAGVAEQMMTGLATGLALEGRTVFTYSIGNFPTLRCLEQIRNDACYHDANVKIVSIGGGFSYGALGMSHHATEDLAILRSIPALTVLAPADRWETEMATFAIAAHDGPCYLRLDKSAAPPTVRDGETFRIGHMRTLVDGADLTIVVCGGIAEEALAAASELLRSHSISCRVLSCHTLKPFDCAAVIDAARTTGGLLTVEEHVLEGGLGGAVSEALLDAGVMPRRFQRLALRGGFSSIVGSQNYLRERYGLSRRHIVDACLAMTSSRATATLA